MKKTPKKENNKSIRKSIDFDKKSIKDKNPDCLTLLPPKEIIPTKELYKKPAYFYGYVFPVHVHFDGEISKEAQVYYGFKNPNTYHSMLLDRIRFYKSKYEESINPVYVIDAFYTAIDAGIYPPMWVLDFVAKVFRTYSEAQGMVSFDNIFGLDIGRGETPIYKTLVINNFYNILCREVYALNSVFNFSIMNACKLIIETFKQKQYRYPSNHEIKLPSLETLKIKYKKVRRDYFKLYPPILSTVGKIIKLRILEKYEKNYDIRNKDKRTIRDLIYLLHNEPYQKTEIFLRDKGLL